MPEKFWTAFPGILAIALIFGGGILYAIINSLANNWRAVRIAEQNAVLKRAMLDQGFTAEQIAQVINSGTDPDAKTDQGT